MLFHDKGVCSLLPHTRISFTAEQKRELLDIPPQRSMFDLATPPHFSPSVKVIIEVNCCSKKNYDYQFSVLTGSEPHRVKKENTFFQKHALLSLVFAFELIQRYCELICTNFSLILIMLALRFFYCSENTYINFSHRARYSSEKGFYLVTARKIITFSQRNISRQM